MGARILLASVCAVLLVAAGCAFDTGVVARVGGDEVRVEDVQDYIGAATGMPWQAVDGRAAVALFDQFVDQEVILHAVLGRESDRDGLAPAERSTSLRTLVRQICGEPPAPSLDQVELELTAATQQIRPSRARVLQLLVDSQDQARESLTRLSAGEPFAQVSAEVSRAANAAQGGELGWIDRGTLPDDLDRVVFSLNAGELSEPVSSPAGYHVFQVLEVVPEGPVSRTELEPVIRKRLADEAAREHTADCVAATAETVGVVVFADHLWFDYSGRYGEAINGG